MGDAYLAAVEGSDIAGGGDRSQHVDWEGSQGGGSDIAGGGKYSQADWEASQVMLLLGTMPPRGTIQCRRSVRFCRSVRC
jgi:hypothetical protein